MSKVIIVGGGAAGMLASIYAARAGHAVHVLEQNEKLGKKLYITGKGRCNITNASDMDVLFASIIKNEKFLYSAFYSFTNEQVVDFFHEIGVETKLERGNRIFPVSDRSSDVINGLKREMDRQGVEVSLRTRVRKIVSSDGSFQKVVLENGRELSGDACIIATGGKSYVSTGSTGDGYGFAKALGHKVTDLYPSLVPFTVKESFIGDLQGLSLKNVEVSVRDGKRELYREQGEMLFTHFGLSGPLVLSASAYTSKILEDREAKLSIDLKPALSVELLDKRVLRDFAEFQNKQFKNALSKLLPAKLIPIIIMRSGIDEYKKVNEISKEERQRLVAIMKGLEFTVNGTRGYKEAIITQGGVNTKEISPSTMESKLQKKTYFIGEVLDLDALTGGFNLQIAWSTAYLAAISIQ